MNKLLIASSWFASIHREHNNHLRSNKFYDPLWFNDYWIPYINRYINNYDLYFYISNCTILPDMKSLINNYDISINYNIAIDNSEEKRHQNDYHSGLMMSAQYALCNQKNLLWIEHDCLVRGLDWFLDWFKDKKISFGCSKKCSAYCNNTNKWAAQSLIWVRNDYLPEFLCRLNKSRLHEGTGTPVPEIIFYELFKDDVDLFPANIGYDRQRPIDFSDKIAFVQQFSDDELEKYLK